MTTLSVWKFDSPEGAADALSTLRQLQAEHHIQLQDAALLSWDDDGKKPSITPLHSLVGPGAYGGAFWGALFALGFMVPALGIAIAAGVGALVAPAAEIGVDERVLKDVRDKVTRGTSALLFLTASAVTDAVLDEMKAHPGHADLIESNLTREQESRLRRIFAPEPTDEPAPRRAAA